MNLASIFLTGQPDGLNGVKRLNAKVENLPYENFLNCCSGGPRNSSP